MDRKTAQDQFFWDPENPQPVEYRGHRIVFDHLEGRFGAVYWDRIGDYMGSSGCEEVEGPEFDRIAAFCSALDSIDEYHDSRGEELVVCDRCAGEGYLLLWGTHRPDVKCGGCDGMGRVPERNAHVAPELRRYLNAITSRVRLWEEKK